LNLRYFYLLLPIDRQTVKEYNITIDRQTDRLKRECAKMLATKFGRNSFGIRSNVPLTDAEIFRVAPSIYATTPHESRSSKYTYIPTSTVLDGLRKEGFNPFMVVQSKSRIEGKSEYTKHMLRLRHVNAIATAETPEIILINSHDGTSSYQMLSGVFRFVCQNGMVCGDTYNDIRVPHRGNIADNVIEAAYTVVEDFETVNNVINEFKHTPLALPEAKIFAEAALSLRYEEEAPIIPDRLLQIRRRDDIENNLWNTFNVVQENIIRGGLHGKNTAGNRTTTRAINSIDTNVKLNKALWTLTEKMAELKR